MSMTAKINYAAPTKGKKPSKNCHFQTNEQSKVNERLRQQQMGLQSQHCAVNPLNL
jgi:hypothetical protein